MDHKTFRETKTSVYLPGAGSMTCAGARPKEQGACLPGAGVHRKSICVYLVQDQGQVCTWCKANDRCVSLVQVLEYKACLPVA